MVLFFLFLLHPFQSLFCQEKDNSFSHKISFDSSDFIFKTENKSTTIRLKNVHQNHLEGTPSLPVLYHAIYVPPNHHFSIRSVSRKSSLKKGLLLSKSIPQHIDTEGIHQKTYKELQDYPKTDEWFPAEIAQKQHIIEFRGYQILLLQINPIQYNAFGKIAKIHSEISYTINFQKDQQKNKQNIDNQSKTISKIKKWIVNPQQLESFSSSKSSNLVPYLIVTHPNYIQAADSLALWKRECGYSVQILSQPNWTAWQIKDSISQRYQSVASLDYVCFLGDHNLVPGFEIIAPDPLPATFASDLLHVCMGGPTDFFPDIAYGRISVSSSTEANNVIRKLIRYERNPTQNSEFYQKAAHCTYFQDDDLDGFDDRRFVQTSEDIRNYLSSHFGLSIDRIYETPAEVNPQNWNNGIYAAGEALPPDLLRPIFEWSGNTSDMLSAMNYGRMYFFHRDHGYSNAIGWAHPQMVSDQIQYIFNLNYLPLVLSINCHSGEFYQTECFAEKMLRSSTGGAFGIFAPASFSYSGYNDAFSMGIIDGFWNSPGLPAIFTGSGGTANPDLDNALAQNKAGDVLIHALIYKTLHWGFNQHSNQVMHFFGDPAVTFYNSEPQEIEVQISDTVFCNSGSYFIQTQNCIDCYASITKNQEWISGGIIINDTLSLNFNPNYGESAILTITGKNKRPLRHQLIWHCQSGIEVPVADFSISNSFACNNAIHFTDESQHLPESHFWDFGDGTFSTEQNPTHTYTESGIFSIKLKVQNQLGSDSITKENLIVSHTPSSPIYSDTLLCQAGMLTLSAQASQTIYWLDEFQNILDSGNTLIVNNISQNTEFYPKTKNLFSGNSLGKPDKSGNGGFIHTNKKHYLVFQSFEDVVLESVNVYSNASGNKTIELHDSIGNLLSSKIHNFTVGMNQIQLDFNVPKNKRYRLCGPTFAKFFANTDSVNYPYQIDDIISIDSSSADNPLSVYYYFYNWKIGRYCYSMNKALSVEILDLNPNITPSGTLMLCPDIEEINIQTLSGEEALWQDSSFSQNHVTTAPGTFYAQQQYLHCTLNSDTLHLVPFEIMQGEIEANCTHQNCTFSFNGNGAIQYLWDFGDGNSSSEENPSHQYADTGIYIVSVLLQNNCDTISIQKEINILTSQIQNIDFEKIKPSPNPFFNGFFIQNPEQKNYQYFLFSTEGKMIKTEKTCSKKEYISMENYSNGLYIISIIENNSISHFKVTKISKE
ncbi:MAG: C25 family cysteine peptidase [Bacteroidales bacterium]|nr:C25 family cysteine peptidase [Bacteroidales bacterium]